MPPVRKDDESLYHKNSFPRWLHKSDFLCQLLHHKQAADTCVCCMCAQVRFIVMNNLFQTPLPIHRRYDLKGSTQGRGAGTTEPDGAGTILKDLDLNIQLKLEEGWHDRWGS